MWLRGYASVGQALLSDHREQAGIPVLPLYSKYGFDLHIMLYITLIQGLDK